MDNQQVTDIEIGWLTGIVDGEGCIAIFRNPGHNNYKSLRPHFEITMTDERALKKVMEIFRKCNLEGWILQKSPGNKKHKPCYCVKLQGYVKVKPVLELLIPHLVIKKVQAELTLDFINRRLEKRSNGHKGLYGKGAVDDYETNLYIHVKDLNKRGPSGTSETTRGAPIKKSDEDMAQSQKG